MVKQILSQYYIGEVHQEDLMKTKEVDLTSPYGNEPTRHPAMKVCSYFDQ